jgi:hypothetical protein
MQQFGNSSPIVYNTCLDIQYPMIDDLSALDKDLLNSRSYANRLSKLVRNNAA